MLQRRWIPLASASGILPRTTGTHPWTGGILPWIGGIFRGEYSDDMMKAVDEYLENNEKIIERMHRKGLMQDIDAEEQLALLHEKIKKYLDYNCPYVMLLMGLTHLRVMEDTDYVSLTELAKRKNLLIRVILFRVG